MTHYVRTILTGFAIGVVTALSVTGIRGHFNALGAGSGQHAGYAFFFLLLGAALAPFVLGARTSNHAPRASELLVVPVALAGAYACIAFLPRFLGVYSLVLSCGFFGIAYVWPADSLVGFARAKQPLLAALSVLICVATGAMGLYAAAFLMYFV